MRGVTSHRRVGAGAAVAAVLLALLGLGTPARATAFCFVLKARDGFVALRERPSADSKLVWRMHAGEMVQIDRTRPSEKGWSAVIYRNSERRITKFGFVADRLIEEECG